MNGTITWEAEGSDGDKDIVDSVPLVEAVDTGEHFELTCRYEKLENGEFCFYRVVIPKFGSSTTFDWSYTGHKGKIEQGRRIKTCNGYVFTGTWIEGKEPDNKWSMTIVLNY